MAGSEIDAAIEFLTVIGGAFDPGKACCQQSCIIDSNFVGQNKICFATGKLKTVDDVRAWY